MVTPTRACSWWTKGHEGQPRHDRRGAGDDGPPVCGDGSRRAVVAARAARRARLRPGSGLRIRRPSPWPRGRLALVAHPGLQHGGRPPGCSVATVPGRLLGRSFLLGLLVLTAVAIGAWHL